MRKVPKFVYRVRFKPSGETYGPTTHAFYTVRGVAQAKVDRYSREGNHELVTYAVTEVKECIPDDVQGY